MNIIGIDLAWQSDKNTSAAAIGQLDGSGLSIRDLRDDLESLEAVVEFVAGYPETQGIAIDAPLIVNNMTGQRTCETYIGRVYGAKKAACHTSNQTRYPNASSVVLASQLFDMGYVHLASPKKSRWQIECYPHPAIIEIFGLAERHPYKKGTVNAKREGQVRLAELIRQLAASPVLKLSVDPAVDGYLDALSIREKRGAALKKNEDALDAIICTYIAGLYDLDCAATVFGDVYDGYVYVPQAYCL